MKNNKKFIYFEGDTLSWDNEGFSRFFHCSFHKFLFACCRSRLSVFPGRFFHFARHAIHKKKKNNTKTNQVFCLFLAKPRCWFIVFIDCRSVISRYWDVRGMFVVNATTGFLATATTTRIRKSETIKKTKQKQNKCTKKCVEQTKRRKKKRTSWNWPNRLPVPDCA